MQSPAVNHAGFGPFFPPSPSFLPPHGNFFPPPNLPFPHSPVIPAANHRAPFLPPPLFLPGGPQNFSQTPQFPTGPPQYHRRPPRNKQSRHHHKKPPPRENFNSGSGTRQQLFVCSPCHKEYKSQHTYDLHLATHIKCSQCDFECSKGAMHDHELVHFLPPELEFTSQEDIGKWREDRKKNFPTAANVHKKQQMQEKRVQQGDVADTPLYRYVSRVCGERGGPPRQRGGRQNNRWVVGSKRSRPPPHHNGESGEGVRMVHWRRGRGRGRYRHGGREKKEYDGCGLNYVPAKKPTLLEKLLANEIRIEQNTLLQCVRHIVSRGFFRPTGDRIGGNSSKSAEDGGVGVGGDEGGCEEHNKSSEVVSVSSEQNL